MAVRHAGHLGRAAAALAISPSAASHRLREAERRLGAQLTVADGRSIRLTPAGLHIADVAEVAQTSLRSAEETARWMSSAERPTVRFALDFYDTAPWLPTLIASEHSTSDVDVVRVAYDGVTDAVLRRRADLGVSVVPTGRSSEPSDDDRSLGDDELVGVAPVDHPAAERGLLVPEDITTAVYVTAGDRPQHGFEHHRFFEPAGVLPHRLRKVESLALLLRILRTSGGLTVQPRLALADAELVGLSVLPLQGPPISVRWTAIMRPEPDGSEREILAVLRRWFDGHAVDADRRSATR